jgi:hypothetical protein
MRCLAKLERDNSYTGESKWIAFQFARKLFMSLLFSRSYEEVTLLFAINAPIMFLPLPFI